MLEKHCDVVLREDDERARPGLHEQPLPDRPQECARSRGAGAHGDPRPRARSRSSPRWTRSRSTSSAASCRSWSHAGRQGPDHLQGRPRGDLPALQELRARRQASADGSPHIEELKEEYERSAPTASACSPSPPRTSRRAAPSRRRHALRQGRRVRPDPQGLRRVPRSTQGDRRGRDRALQRHGVAVKVITGDNELVARKICKEVGLSTESCCWATTSRR